MPKARSAKKRKIKSTTYVSRAGAPQTMRAVAINSYGGPAKLDVREIDVRRPSAHEVLIRIDTSGVGIWDASMRKGEVPTEHGFPLVLGTDGAGVVVDVGARVTRFKRGDRVWAYVFDNKHGGFNAEYATVLATSVGHVPRELDLERAGALTVLGLTALQGVDDALHIEANESIVVHGASGNVGMIAVQLARWRGARILATASGKDGVTFVRRLGIDNVIDGKRDDVADAVRDFAPEGLDAVLAFAGGDDLLVCMDALRKGGRVGYPNGVDPAPRKRKHIRIIAYDAEASPESFAALSRAVVASRLQVPIAKAFLLEHAADAHRMVERGRPLGKVVMRA
jgi:NADPH:quinone reductase-like Zn-dependent oxidoreductase